MLVFDARHATALCQDSLPMRAYVIRTNVPPNVRIKKLYVRTNTTVGDELESYAPAMLMRFSRNQRKAAA